MFRKNWEWLSQYFSFYIHPDIIGKTKGKNPNSTVCHKNALQKMRMATIAGFSTPPVVSIVDFY